jgi:hypothetical protein
LNAIQEAALASTASFLRNRPDAMPEISAVVGDADGVPVMFQWSLKMRKGN